MNTAKPRIASPRMFGILSRCCRQLLFEIDDQLDWMAVGINKISKREREKKTRRDTRRSSRESESLFWCNDWIGIFVWISLAVPSASDLPALWLIERSFTAETAIHYDHLCSSPVSYWIGEKNYRRNDVEEVIVKDQFDFEFGFFRFEKDLPSNPTCPAALS